MEKKEINLGLDGLESLIPKGDNAPIVQLVGIQEIPIDQIDDFPNHPFKVREDEDMTQLIESVQERGVITPVTVRKRENGRYEMISGHRRKTACQLAGIETIRAEVKELTDDEAIILMVESNFQRSRILPSEKAFAYKMQYEAIKRQGERTDLTSSPVGTKLRNDQKIALASEDGRTQIHRYLRLTNLNKDLLDLVDEGRIALRPAVELSYLNPDEQIDLMDTIRFCDATPSLSQAIYLRGLSQQGRVYPEVMEAILSQEKPNQKEKISFKTEQIRRYIPKSVPYEQTSNYVIKALEFYSKHLERNRNLER